MDFEDNPAQGSEFSRKIEACTQPPDTKTHSTLSVPCYFLYLKGFLGGQNVKTTQLVPILKPWSHFLSQPDSCHLGESLDSYSVWCGNSISTPRLGSLHGEDLVLTPISSLQKKPTNACWLVNKEMSMLLSVHPASVVHWGGWVGWVLMRKYLNERLPSYRYGVEERGLGARQAWLHIIVLKRFNSVIWDKQLYL